MTRDNRIIDALDEAFTNHEHLVPAAEQLRPAIAEGIRRRRFRRRMAWSAGAAFAVVLMALAPAVLRAAPHWQTPLIGGSGATTAPLNLLVLGVDGSPGEVGRTPVRADAILLLRVDRVRNRAYQVSIPRDLSVEIPGHGVRKVNSAYALGGYALTERTVNRLAGITIDAGVVVDFHGMQAIIDAVGGVQLCVDQRTVSSHIGIDANGNFRPPFQDGSHPVSGVRPVVYEVGCQRFKSWQALDYVRQRANLPNGAQDRDRHLRQLLEAVARELTDPVKLAHALPVAGSALELHTGAASLPDLAAQLRGLDPGRLSGARLPASATENGSAALLQPDSEQLLAAFRQDRLDEWLAAHPAYRS